MTVRAEADRKFIRKYLFLAAAGLAFFLWGTYDSFYKFPVDLEMAEAFDPISKDPNAIQLWAQLYEENKDRGWHREKPHNSAETVRGYWRFNNYVFIGGGLCLMLFFLMKYARTIGSWMESTETGINTSWGKSFDFEKIREINKRRWEAKGIAKVSYEDAGGQKRTMVFDDFKYQREPMAELMTMCEQGLDPSQIVGGKSQAEIAAEKEAESADDDEGDDQQAD